MMCAWCPCISTQLLTLCCCVTTTTTTSSGRASQTRFHYNTPLLGPTVVVCACARKWLLCNWRRVFYFNKIFYTLFPFIFESSDPCDPHIHDSHVKCCRYRVCGNSKDIVIESRLSVASFCVATRRHSQQQKLHRIRFGFSFFSFSGIDNVSSLPIENALIHGREREHSTQMNAKYGIKYDEDNSLLFEFFEFNAIGQYRFQLNMEHARDELRTS